jgi:hypothetical protein
MIEARVRAHFYFSTAMLYLKLLIARRAFRCCNAGGLVDGSHLSRFARYEITRNTRELLREYDT